MIAGTSQGIDAHLRELWSAKGDHLANIGEVMRHPEAGYLREIEAEFLDSPDDYQQWISRVGDERLQHDKSLAQRDTSLADVRRQWESGAIGPHVAAEAMQVIVNDLTIIEEMTYAAQIHDDLRRRLTQEACDLVGRLVKNTVRDCRAKLQTGDVNRSLVRPLRSELQDTRSYSLEGRWQPTDDPVLLIMTAGRGTRLRTTIPKALLPLGGQSLLHSILKSAQEAGIEQALIVLRFGAEFHPPVFGGSYAYVTQETALGTGHSAAVGLEYLRDHKGAVVLSYSDTPFLSPQSFRAILDPVRHGGSDFTILTVPASVEPDFGRLCFDGERITGIGQPRFGEQGSDVADAGLYAGMSAVIRSSLSSTENHNHRYEYSLTQVVEKLSTARAKIQAVPIANPTEVLGINRPADYIRARMLANRPSVQAKNESTLTHDLQYFSRYVTTHGSPNSQVRQLIRLADTSRGALFTIGSVERI